MKNTSRLKILLVLVLLLISSNSASAAIVDEQPVRSDTISFNANITGNPTFEDFTASQTYSPKFLRMYIGGPDVTATDKFDVSIRTYPGFSPVCSSNSSGGRTTTIGGPTLTAYTIDLTTFGYGTCSLTNGNHYVILTDVRNAAFNTSRIYVDTLGDSSLTSMSEMYFQFADTDGFAYHQNTNITTSTTWYSGRVYVVEGSIEVASGDTLTIEPGTIVKFDNNIPSSLEINGNLVAEGDENNATNSGYIFFTSIKDDSILGFDTDGLGNSTGSPGNWGGIIIGPSGNASFDYAVIRFAGASGTSQAQILNNGGTIVMENSDVAHGTTYGIKNLSGSATIHNSDIGYNDYGFYLDGGTAMVNTDNVIHDNSAYGIYNNTISSINAQYNYWGHPSGPMYDGDHVYGDVDVTYWKDYVYYSDEATCHLDDTCGAVRNGELVWDGTTTYSSELEDSLTSWDLGKVDIIEATTSYKTLLVIEDSIPDVIWKGALDPNSLPYNLLLNSYYLENNTSAERQNTITHELGHALGLNHSYTGNVMYFNQTPQVLLGPQDIIDYNKLWQ